MYIRPILVNRHKSSFDLYIGRGTIFGNPFNIDISTGTTRQVAIEMYREHLYKSLEDGTITVQDILNLSGKTIACSCSPLPCHGDIILEVFDCIIEELSDGKEKNN